ncbi:Glycoside hydrolase family 13 protein [Mycena sanguinolenta]|uniref:Glycoside hydrolase family 13 protein n=1 Tax=Mycena sanguinolenta TaxID=230812 RepID=A0A8H6YVF3_9AGAR|nr:Glycoside hydrolase family 13 protein [Mycena sanguinolenta]
MLPSPLAVLVALVLLSRIRRVGCRLGFEIDLPGSSRQRSPTLHFALTRPMQLVTDRFATSNDSATACDTSLRTYCGGTWTGIANHLDYIQDMGFDAVWISPLPLNLDGTAYWLTDLDTLNPHFGTADDLKNLSSALHTRGMYLMVDVVVNHYAGNPQNTTPSSLDLFDTDYPALLPFGTESDFHPQGFITDYTNQTEVEQCWLGDEKLPLPDVDTEDEDVVDTLYAWIKNTVAEYAASAGVFNLGEVENDDPTYLASYLDVLDGVLDYPTYYKLVAAFSSPSGNLSALSGAPTVQSVAPRLFVLFFFVRVCVFGAQHSQWDVLALSTRSNGSLAFSDGRLFECPVVPSHGQIQGTYLFGFYSSIRAPPLQLLCWPYRQCQRDPTREPLRRKESVQDVVPGPPVYLRMGDAVRELSSVLASAFIRFIHSSLVYVASFSDTTSPSTRRPWEQGVGCRADAAYCLNKIHAPPRPKPGSVRYNNATKPTNATTPTNVPSTPNATPPPLSLRLPPAPPLLLPLLAPVASAGHAHAPPLPWLGVDACEHLRHPRLVP